MKLNQLSDNPLARQDRKRIGRGIGSGIGKTSGRGHKGQKSRSGASIKGFEGGQMPLHRRLPKRGFKNIFRKDFVTINLDRLQTAIDAGKLDPKKPVDAAALRAAGVFKNTRDGVRLLAKGALKTKVDITVAGASKAAAAAVEKAGGSLTLLVVADKAGKERAAAAVTKGPEA
jgi:large subunit ribosomal protein L15